MNDEKRKEIQKSIDEFQKELQELKEENPTENYEQLENIINRLQKMLSGTNQKGYAFKTFFKMACYWIILFVIYVVCMGAMMGFFFQQIHVNDPMAFAYLIPCSAFVLFICHRLASFVNSLIHSEHLFINFLFSYLVIVLLLALIDYAFIHIGGNFWISLVVLFGATLLSAVGEFYLTRKWILW